MSNASAKRCSPRIDVLYDAVLAASDGLEIAAVIKVMSAEGFRVEIGGELHVGEQVT